MAAHRSYRRTNRRLLAAWLVLVAIDIALLVASFLMDPGL